VAAVKHWLTLALIAFLVSLLVRTSFLQKPSKIADTTLLYGFNFIRLLFGLGGIMFFYGAGTVALSPTARSDWWVSVLLATFGVGCVAFWPRQVVTDPLGVTQSGIIGIGRRTIQWQDVDYATENPQSGGIEVVPKEGKKMVFSPLLIGSNEFLARISHRRWVGRCFGVGGKFFRMILGDGVGWFGVVCG
jgi:hypothetical protein